MPSKYNQLASELRMLKASLRGRPLSAVALDATDEETGFLRAQLSSHRVHRAHCGIVQENVHFPSAAAFAVRDQVSREHYAEARRLHRHAGSLRHDVFEQPEPVRWVPKNDASGSSGSASVASVASITAGRVPWLECCMDPIPGMLRHLATYGAGTRVVRGSYIP